MAFEQSEESLEFRLRETAELDGGENKILSLFVDNHWNDFWGREAARTYFKDHTRRLRRVLKYVKDWDTADVLADMDMVENYLDDVFFRGKEAGAAGIARFVCSPMNLDVSFRVGARFNNTLSLSRYPQIAQLVRVTNDLPQTYVVMVDSKTVRIIEVVDGVARGEESLVSSFPGRHKQGGWSQIKYQRHVEGHAERIWREGGEYVTRLVDEEPSVSLMASGPPTIINAFLDVLPKRVRDKVSVFDSSGVGEAQGKVVERVVDELKARDVQDTHERLNRMEEVALRGGLAVLGVEDVLNALVGGRVHVLYLASDFQSMLYGCTVCGLLYQEEFDGSCKSCGGGLAPMDPLEDLARVAVQRGAMVKLVSDSAVLDLHGGLAAETRY